MAASQQQTEKYSPILGGFVPLAALWDQAASGPLFPSENSARWFIRSHRDELVEAQAIGIHAGCTIIHRERFEAVAQRAALLQAARA